MGPNRAYGKRLSNEKTLLRFFVFLYDQVLGGSEKNMVTVEQMYRETFLKKLWKIPKTFYIVKLRSGLKWLDVKNGAQYYLDNNCETSFNTQYYGSFRILP